MVSYPAKLVVLIASTSAARLELLDQSIIQDLVEWKQVSMVSNQQVRLCPMPSYTTGER